MTLTANRSPLPIVFLALIAIVVLAAIAVGQSYSHADTKHVSDAEIIRNACNGSGFYKTWLNPDGRFVQTCFVGNRIGFRVLEKINGRYEEITAYFRDRLEGMGRAGIEQWAKDFKWKVVVK